MWRKIIDLSGCIADRGTGMTTVERADRDVDVADDTSEIAVTIVDTDVHPIPVSADVLKSYAPKEWVDRIWPTGNAVTTIPKF
jgi:hypothetical protein